MSPLMLPLSGNPGKQCILGTRENDPQTLLGQHHGHPEGQTLVAPLVTSDCCKNVWTLMVGLSQCEHHTLLTWDGNFHAPLEKAHHKPSKFSLCKTLFSNHKVSASANGVRCHLRIRLLTLHAKGRERQK